MKKEKSETKSNSFISFETVFINLTVNIGVNALVRKLLNLIKAHDG